MPIAAAASNALKITERKSKVENFKVADVRKLNKYWSRQIQLNPMTPPEMLNKTHQYLNLFPLTKAKVCSALISALVVTHHK